MNDRRVSEKERPAVTDRHRDIQRRVSERNSEAGEGGSRGGTQSGEFVGRAPRGRVGGKVKGEEEVGKGGWGGGIVTRELKVLLRSSLSPSNLHWS